MYWCKSKKGHWGDGEGGKQVFSPTICEKTKGEPGVFTNQMRENETRLHSGRRSGVGAPPPAPAPNLSSQSRCWHLFLSLWCWWRHLSSDALVEAGCTSGALVELVKQYSSSGTCSVSSQKRIFCSWFTHLHYSQSVVLIFQLLHISWPSNICYDHETYIPCYNFSSDRWLAASSAYIFHTY